MIDNHELDFWTKFVHSNQFKTWLSEGKTPELDSYVHEIITANPEANVLDLGSGVVSILNGTVPKEKLTACDVLGDKYRDIFDYEAHGIKPPDSFPGESLPYDSELFDICHIRNAIDHCESPIVVLDEMIRVCKTGGIVIVQGFEDEAEHENYQGFHQWNMRVTPSGLLWFLGKSAQSHSMDGKIKSKYGEHSIKKLPNGRNWITWIYRK